MLIPLISKLSIAKKASSMTLRDITGTYNVSTNPGGYGTPNLASPPVSIGLTWRQWDATVLYRNFVTSDAPTITELLSSTGHEFLATTLGIAKFEEGVNHIKYYPLEAVADSEFSVVAGSKTITLVTPTLGMFNPTTLDSAYKAAVLVNSGGAVVTGIMLLGDSVDWTTTTFTVDTAWAGTTGTDYTLMIGTEADLKVLVKEGTEGCISGKVGKLAKMECCDRKVIDRLTDLTMWMFSAEIEMQCAQYQAANDLVLAAYKECTYCISPDCLTCSNP